ncbi:hypothetical protein BDN72DRAFT_894059 [Pluteus cervinus]|uniref:Uncharacterized protein n=1 Tax=Pluteus cervinus TaxID=181527 RepID=A0ACD3B5X8_9AGAR|nr:hypothetical protein BDN72DRAFT_894059 [Pluteus cervinus]
MPLPAALAAYPKDAPYFPADNSNPLHADDKQNTLAKSAGNDGFQPFNIGGLKRGKPPQIDLTHAAALIPRPGTAMSRPSDQRNEPNRRLSHRPSSFGNILAPTPRQAAVSGPTLLSEPPTSGEINTTSTMDVTLDSNQNSAHISGISVLPNPGPTESQEPSNHEVLNVAMKGIYAGPRRLIVRPDTAAPPVVDVSPEKIAPAMMTSAKQNPSHKKRPHPENEKRLNHNDEYAPPLKQPKLSKHSADQGAKNQDPPPPFGYSDHQNDLLPWMPAEPQPPQVHQGHTSYARRREPQDSVHQVLCGKIFGCDTDEYIQEHIQKYDALFSKWQDSTLEDWEAGADEMAAKFGDVLDFAKTRMSAKLRLYATFDAKTAAHKATLRERDRVLASAKNRLVQDSGSFLGR